MIPTFVGKPKPTKMTYSNEDFERFYIRYKAEAMPRGVSIQAYCSNNNVPYNLFDKWYRDTRHKIVNVRVDGIPVENPTPAKEEEPHVTGSDMDVKIKVDICMTNGLHIQKRGMSYADLKDLITNLEVLC